METAYRIAAKPSEMLLRFRGGQRNRRYTKPCAYDFGYFARRYALFGTA